MAVWYSVWSFGILFPFWYVWTKKNLATLRRSRLVFESSGCQDPFLPGLPDFCWYMIPKPEKCTKSTQNVPNVLKIFQMAIKYINIFLSKALKNLPKLVFLV
jgi:hypothetical protein